MPPPRRFAGVLADRRVPWRTRAELALAEARRRIRPVETYRLHYGGGWLFLSHADYEIDWETLKNTLVDEPYLADYRGAVVLDLGAHKGTFGAYALAHGAAAVVSYEPEAANVELLARSAAAFTEAGRSWRVVKAAVSAAAGEAELHVMRSSWGHTLHPPEAWAPHETGLERVPVLAMADVLRDALAAEDADARLLVKINTEGEECETVLGTPVESWEAVDELIVETHPWTTCTAEDLADHLASAGLTRVESRHERLLQLRREPPRSGRRSDPT
jgi:FkbM family methyltransferase